MLYKILYTMVMMISAIMTKFNPTWREFIQRRCHQRYHYPIGWDSEKKAVWIHASSVGEVNLLEPLLKIDRGTSQVLLTVMTDTGYAQAKRRYEHRKEIVVEYFPLDRPKDIKKILQTYGINKLFLVETELWPNVVSLASKQGKVYVINGRISEKSFKQYEKIRWVLRPLFHQITHFYMQTKEDKRRIEALGAAPIKTSIMGNLKYSVQVAPLAFEEQEAWVKQYQLKDKMVVTLGSTHEHEEYFFLSWLKTLSEKEKVFLVPRHIDRRESIKKWLQENHIAYSSWQEPSKHSVILVDTMGVLRSLYALSHLCFVGGTLDDTGGHNLLEPLYVGKRSYFGPNTRNAKEIAQELKRSHMGVEFETIEEFKEIVAHYSLAKESQEGERIEAFMRGHQGAVKQVCSLLE